MPTNADAFRSLMEGKITTEQYLRILNERADELRQTSPDHPQSQRESVPA